MNTETLSIDFDTSAKLAGLIQAMPRQCWKNAIKALPLLPGGRYVEGCLVDGFPIEHGWCEWEGKIVDPTLYNDLETPYFYLPGVKYTFEDVVKRVPKKSVTLPLVYHEKGAGFGGFGVKSYLDAYNQALGLFGSKIIYK